MAAFIEHVTTDGDRWDLIAWTYYGSASAIEGIIAANPHIRILGILPGGLVVRVPLPTEAVPVLPPEALPPWKR